MCQREGTKLTVDARALGEQLRYALPDASSEGHSSIIKIIAKVDEWQKGKVEYKTGLSASQNRNTITLNPTALIFRKALHEVGDTERVHVIV